MAPNKQRTFLRFLLSYLLVLLIPVMAGGLVYLEAEKVIGRYAREATSTMLEQVREILDSRLGETAKTARQLALDIRLKGIASVRGRLGPGDYYTIWSLYRDLHTYRLTDPAIMTSYVYLKNSDTVVSPEASGESAGFYGTHLRYAGVSYRQWLRMLNERIYRGECTPAIRIILDDTVREVVPFYLSIPLENPQSQHGVIAILLDLKKIESLLGRLARDDRSAAYIVGEDGKVIAGVFKGMNNKSFNGRLAPAVDRDRALVVTDRSRNAAWRYVAAVPTGVVMKRAAYIRNISVLAAMLAVAGGIAASYNLARRNIRPLKEIVRAVTGLFGESAPGQGSEYEVLHGTLARVSEIIADRDELRAAIDRQKPLMKMFYLHYLLHGYLGRRDEIENLGEYVGVRINGRCYYVTIATLPAELDLKEIEIVGPLLQQAFSGAPGGEAPLLHLGRHRFAILSAQASADPDQSRAAMQTVLQQAAQVLETNGIHPMFAVGNPSYDLDELNRSYDEARQAADYQLAGGYREIVWYDELPGENIRYYYPPELEDRLLLMIKTGNRDEVAKIMETVEETNLRHRALRGGMLMELRRAVCATAGRAAEGILPEEDGRALQRKLGEEDGIAPFFTAARTAFLTLCDRMAEVGRRNRQAFIREIVEYLRQNYGDAGLCLKSAAWHYKVSPARLSELFTEVTGDHFSGFLQNIRLEHACDLLARTGLPIREVALRTGYNDDKVFRRAFKRVMGVSPLDYRRAGLKRA